MPLPLFVPDTAVVAIEQATANAVLLSSVPGNGSASDSPTPVTVMAMDGLQGALSPSLGELGRSTRADDAPVPSLLLDGGSAQMAGTSGESLGLPAAPTVVEAEEEQRTPPQDNAEAAGISNPAQPEDGQESGLPSEPQGAQDGPGLDMPAQTAPPTAPESAPTPEPASDSGDDQPVTVVNGVPLLLRADEQTFDPSRQIITAAGDVLVQYGDAQLAADRLWINLQNQYLWAEGEVFFNRNTQIIQGDRAAYNLAQGSGAIYGARGELALSDLDEDLGTLGSGTTLTNAPVDYRLQDEGSISQVTSPGGFTLATNSLATLFGGEPNTRRKLRFEATTVLFDEDGWYLQDLQITNDPFSPPELILRGNSARLSRINADQDELLLDNPQLVFDQGLAIPLVQSRYVLNRGQLNTDDLNPFPTAIGFDDEERDGLFIERQFDIGLAGPWDLTLTPQFYVSRWLNESEGDLLDPANYGAVARLTGTLGPRTTVTGTVGLAGFDLDNISEQLRANLRAQQLVGDHTLNLEYSYRDQLFNGTLGFQDVQSSLGLLVASPVYVLGDSQITLQYQGSGQYITANTDDPDLINDPTLTTDLTDLFRFQGSVLLGRWFPLWSGETPEATPTEGLRFSPRPLTPYVGVAVGLAGVGTYYTSDDVQASLEGSVAVLGRFGQLKRDFLDYTEFNLGFASKLVTQDLSPFLFDRDVDNNVLSGGLLQQLYGPFLAGFQTSFNVDTGAAINTDLVLEYRRRTYGLVVTFNPVQRTGFVGFRVSDFDWQGQTEPFAPPLDPPSP